MGLLTNISLDNRVSVRTDLLSAQPVATGDVNPIIDRINSIAPDTDIVAAKRAVISGNGSTVTLTNTQSGYLILMDRAAGIVFTLPSATSTIVGTYFDFLVTVSVTSNAYTIQGASSSDLFLGGLGSDDTDTSNAARYFNANGSSHYQCTMNGTTTGGLIGTTIRVTCVSANKWLIEGVNKASGIVATPFA